MISVDRASDGFWGASASISATLGVVMAVVALSAQSMVGRRSPRLQRLAVAGDPMVAGALRRLAHQLERVGPREGDRQTARALVAEIDGASSGG